MGKTKISSRELTHLLQASDETAKVESIELECKAKWPLRATENVRFIDVQFNSPLIGGRFSKPAFANCVFHGCDLDGISVWQATFVDCEFLNCILGQELVGIFKSCALKSSVFKSCRMSAINFVGCAIEDSRFVNNRIRDVEFVESVLSGVTVAGSMKNVSFQKCELMNLDLSTCSLDEVTFHSCTRQSTHLPDSPRNFVISTAVFGQAKEALRSKLSENAFREYCELTDWLEPVSLDMSVSEKWFKDLPEGERQIVLDELYSVSHESR